MYTQTEDKKSSSDKEKQNQILTNKSMSIPLKNHKGHTPKKEKNIHKEDTKVICYQRRCGKKLLVDHFGILF